MSTIYTDFPFNSQEIHSLMSTGGRPVVNYWQKLVNVVKERPLACFVMCCVLSQTFLQIAGVATNACFAYLLCFYANISRSCKAFTLLGKKGSNNLSSWYVWYVPKKHFTHNVSLQ